ncbi:TPA: hypothetical protein P0E36_004900 [Vibrio harveyi]|nr:hypothetical protein [Vibrio harveyi]
MATPSDMKRKLLADADSHRARLEAFLLTLEDKHLLGKTESQVMQAFSWWNLELRMEFDEKFRDGNLNRLTEEEEKRFVEYVCSHSYNEFLDEHSAD